MKKLALIICLPALIAGCGKKNNEDTEAPTPSTKPNTEAPKPPVQQPKSGGEDQGIVARAGGGLGEIGVVSG